MFNLIYIIYASKFNAISLVMTQMVHRTFEINIESVTLIPVMHVVCYNYGFNACSMNAYYPLLSCVEYLCLAIHYEWHMIQ